MYGGLLTFEYSLVQDSYLAPFWFGLVHTAYRPPSSMDS